MSSPEHQVYTDPREQGRPQVGDVVVAIVPMDGSWGVSMPTRWNGRTCVLDSVWPSSFSPWRVRIHGYGSAQVASVRRPTEAELAAWALIPPLGTG